MTPGLILRPLRPRAVGVEILREVSPVLKDGTRKQYFFTGEVGTHSISRSEHKSQFVTVTYCIMAGSNARVFPDVERRYVVEKLNQSFTGSSAFSHKEIRVEEQIFG